MQNFWKINNSKSNKLVLIKDNCIYIGNPKQEILNNLNTKTTNLDFLDNLFSIPYSYIRKIENPKGKNKIQIFYGNDSEEELIIENIKTKDEIFNFLKLENTNLKYSSITPSIMKYSKVEFFALLFSSIVFISSLYMAIQIENGVEYVVSGAKRPGIITIILMIAYLGVSKIIIGYVVLITIIIFKLFRKLKYRDEIEYLQR